MLLPKTVSQLRCIWGLAKKLDMTPEKLRALVKQICPGTGGHLSTLHSTEATEIIRLLKKRARQPYEKYWQKERQKKYEPPKPMDPSQRDKAFLLAREIKRAQHRGQREGAENEEAWDLLHKLARHMDVQWFHRCNAKQAAAIIEALKDIKKRT